MSALTLVSEFADIKLHKIIRCLFCFTAYIPIIRQLINVTVAVDLKINSIFESQWPESLTLRQ